MDLDYAIHSDFLIHWTGRDIDERLDPDWYTHPRKRMRDQTADAYISRLRDILKHGLWMTEEAEVTLSDIAIPATPRTCFTELKVSLSMRHAHRYGRLGIGVKRPYLFTRLGRPLIYYGYHNQRNKDIFLDACARDLRNKSLLNFFEPMNSSQTLNYDFYGESEWRIIYIEDLLSSGLIVDPRVIGNAETNEYFGSLNHVQQQKLRYLISLDGWFSMLIYPSLAVKNKSQQDESTLIRQFITEIKERDDHGNRVESNNRQ
jgi:hypothetical protein